MKNLALKIPLLSATIVATLWGCSGDESSPVIPDTTPPTVISTSPADGDTNAGVNVAISATFSEEMDRWTFTLQTFAIGGVGQGNILYKDKTVSFTPSDGLAFGREYTAVITTDVTDAADNNLESNYDWTFTTTLGVAMPLEIENKWEYLVEQRDTIGDSNISSGITIIEIVSDTIIGTEQWFISETGEMYTNKDNGLWMMSLTGQPYLFIKFPAAAGDTYFANPDLVETIRVDSINIARWANLERYECNLYTSTVSDPTFKHQYFYDSNVGLVSIDKVPTGSTQVVERWSLIRFTLF